jgi:hypothetical protein
VNNNWARLLLRHLSADGGLVINFEGSKSLRASALATAPALKRKFGSRFSFAVPGYDNRIGAFFRGQLRREVLAQNLKTIEEQHRKKVTRRLAAEITRF